MGMISIREERMWSGMMKYHIEGLPFGAVLHHFTEPDHGEPHDHPWGFRSTIMKGMYIEESFDSYGCRVVVPHYLGNSFFVPMERIHRIIELPLGECWTLIQPMPEFGTQKSGFYRWVEGSKQHRFWDEEWSS